MDASKFNLNEFKVSVIKCRDCTCLIGNVEKRYF